MNKNQGRTL